MVPGPIVEAASIAQYSNEITWARKGWRGVGEEEEEEGMLEEEDGMVRREEESSVGCVCVRFEGITQILLLDLVSLFGRSLSVILGKLLRE